MIRPVVKWRNSSHYGDLEYVQHERRLPELLTHSIRTNRTHVIQPVVEWRSASHLRDLDSCSSCRFGGVVSCIKEDLDDVVRRRPCESPVFTITLVASNINIT